MTDPSITDLVSAAHMQLESMRRNIATLRAAGKFNREYLDIAERSACYWFVDLAAAVTGVVPATPIPRISLPFDYGKPV